MTESDAPLFERDGAHPEIGSLVYDDGRRVVGRVVAIGYRVTLRPEGGGREWDPEWENLRHPTEADLLASRVRVANRASGSLRAAAHPEIATFGAARDPNT